MDNPRNPLNNSDSQNQYKQPVRKAPSENQRSVGRSASSSYQKKQTEEKIYAQPPRSFKRSETTEQKKTKKELFLIIFLMVLLQKIQHSFFLFCFLLCNYSKAIK